MKSKKQKKSNWRSLLNTKVLVFAFALVSLPVLVGYINYSTAPSSVEAAGISPIGQTDEWSMIFSDEFNDDSLNLSVWEPSWFGGTNISNPINTDEDGCYDPAQVSVSNGMLNLAATSTTNPNCKVRSGARANYASGLVNTRNSFTFTYGYAEARMYLPGSNGEIWNWPAFWTDGTGEWPVTGEIDIMEGLSSHKPCWHYHYQDSKNTHQSPGDCADNMNGTGWHTYAAKWEANKITYYYDGVEVGTITEGIVDAKHFIILNNGINDRYGINVPATVMVDYVRVWQKPVPGSTPTPTPTPTPVPTATPTPFPTPTVIPTPTPTATPVPTPLPTATPVPTPTPAPTSGLSVESFELSPSGVIRSRSRVSANTVIKSSSKMKVDAITIAVRDSRNRNYDFRGAKTNVTITPEGYSFKPSAKRFQKGEYTAFVAYKLDGKWYNMSPQISFTVK